MGQAPACIPCELSQSLQETELEADQLEADQKQAQHQTLQPEPEARAEAEADKRAMVSRPEGKEECTSDTGDMLHSVLDDLVRGEMEQSHV